MDQESWSSRLSAQANPLWRQTGTLQRAQKTFFLFMGSLRVPYRVLGPLLGEYAVALIESGWNESGTQARQG